MCVDFGRVWEWSGVAWMVYHWAYPGWVGGWMWEWMDGVIDGCLGCCGLSRTSTRSPSFRNTHTLTSTHTHKTQPPHPKTTDLRNAGVKAPIGTAQRINEWLSPSPELDRLAAACDVIGVNMCVCVFTRVCVIVCMCVCAFIGVLSRLMWCLCGYWCGLVCRRRVGLVLVLWIKSWRALPGQFMLNSLDPPFPHTPHQNHTLLVCMPACVGCRCSYPYFSTPQNGGEAWQIDNAPIGPCVVCVCWCVWELDHRCPLLVNPFGRVCVCPCVCVCLCVCLSGQVCRSAACCLLFMFVFLLWWASWGCCLLACSWRDRSMYRWISMYLASLVYDRPTDWL
jgi:hypothetical protein